MKLKTIFYLSTTLTAFFMAVFVIGSIHQSAETPENFTNSDPTVESTMPSDGDMDVPRNVVIEITFSEDVDSTVMNNSSFTLIQGTESVTGTLEFSDNVGTFTPNRNLEAESEYTAILTMGEDRPVADYTEHRFNDEESDERQADSNVKEWSFTTGGNTDVVEKVDLGSAANYVILAHTSINNDETSEITGQKGFDPDFKSSKEDKTAYWLKNEDIDKEKARRDTTDKKSDNREYAAGERDSDSENLDEALEDMMTAYSEASERTPVDFVDYKMKSSSDKNEMYHSDYDSDDHTDDRRDDRGDDVRMGDVYDDEQEMDTERDRSSTTLDPGVYKWNESVEISNNITLSGSADDVWIFQISEDLTVDRDVQITLSDGAVAENIFWQVAGEVNLGESSHFEGIILSETGITMKNRATLNGRMLTLTDINLDENTIIDPQQMASTQRTGRD